MYKKSIVSEISDFTPSGGPPRVTDTIFHEKWGTAARIGRIEEMNCNDGPPPQGNVEPRYAHDPIAIQNPAHM